MAAVIASRVATFIQSALQLQDAPTYFWGTERNGTNRGTHEVKKNLFLNSCMSFLIIIQ